MASWSEAEDIPETETFRRLRAPQVVSLWLGNFSSEDELLDYLEENFTNDFGFEIYEPAGPEQDVSSTGPKLIYDLLDGFSQYKNFRDDAVKLAKSKGWEKATTAVVFYAFKYDPSLIKRKKGFPLTFIGTVPNIELKK